MRDAAIQSRAARMRPPIASSTGAVRNRNSIGRRMTSRKNARTLSGMAFDVYLLALLVGIFAGFRSMAAPAAVSWAARLGALDLRGTTLAFFGQTWTPWIFTA